MTTDFKEVVTVREFPPNRSLSFLFQGSEEVTLCPFPCNIVDGRTSGLEWVVEIQITIPTFDLSHFLLWISTPSGSR